MADEPTVPQPKAGMKRLILMAGIGVGSLAIVGGALTVVTMKVTMVHDLWCKKIGTFCVKEVGKPPPPPPKPVPAGNCPDFKIIGSLKSRNPDESVWVMLADVSGKVVLTQGNDAASGKSTVSCYNGQFLGSFTDMTNGLTYQCEGAIDGAGYSGVCNFSNAEPHDVSGVFTNLIELGKTSLPPQQSPTVVSQKN